MKYSLQSGLRRNLAKPLVGLAVLTAGALTSASLFGNVNLGSLAGISSSSADTLLLTLVSQTSNKVTFSWTAPSNAQGYVFRRDGARVSSTWDGQRYTITFGKPDAAPHVYQVEAITDAVAGDRTVPAVPAPPTTTTVATGWTVAAPRAPITTVLDPPSLGLNVNNVSDTTYNDYVIDGGGDSSLLLQGTTHGDTFNRFHITRTASNPIVTYPAHGMYVRAYSNTFNDIYMDNSGGHGDSSFTVRMRDNTFNRTITKGYQFVSYFEYDPLPGTITFNQGDWTFTSNTAIWVDNGGVSTLPALVNQAFLIKDVVARGPAGARFFSAAAGVYAGAGVTLQNDTLCNTACHPVTTTDVAGIPSGKLTIQ